MNLNHIFNDLFNKSDLLVHDLQLVYCDKKTHAPNVEIKYTEYIPQFINMKINHWNIALHKI